MINKIIQNFLNINKASYTLKNDNRIAIRCEYKKNDNDKNVFIYLENFNEFIIILKSIKEHDRHFYEVIGDKCKFFLDLDAKCKDMLYEDWNNKVNLIKKEMEIFFKDKFDKDIKILEFQSFPLLLEPKFSCHLIVSDYCFNSEDCKIICNMFLNYLINKKLGLEDIIDSGVYGKNRMLRIEGSTKINSFRKKICINSENKEYINLDGLITNIEDTSLLNIENIFNYEIKETNFNKYNHNYDINNKNILVKENNKRYNYTDSDVLYLKDNIKDIINKINNWHYKNIQIDNKNDIFTILKIFDNRMDLKRLKSFNCPICKRIHENQNAYIFVTNKNILFNCRRCINPININSNNID